MIRPRPARPGESGETKIAVSSKDDPSKKGTEQAGEIVARAFNLAGVGEDDALSGMVAITPTTDPTTAKWRPIYKGLSMGPGPVSPDGRYIVYSSLGPDPDADKVGIWIYDMKGETAPRRIFERGGEPHWTDHGRAVVIGAPIGPGWQKFETWRVNADGTGRVKLPFPETDFVLDCSRDGKWLVTRTNLGEVAEPGPLTLVHSDGTGARKLSDGPENNVSFSLVSTLMFSPDGRRVAYAGIKTINGVLQFRLFVIDIEGNQRRELPLTFEPDVSPNLCWSPDGSRLAIDLGNARTKESRIAVVDLDGANFRDLPLPPGRWNLGLCDWNILTPGLKIGSPDDRLDRKSPAGRYQSLLREVNNAKAFQPRKYVGRFLEFAESAPNDPAAIDALIWIITFGFDGPEFSRAIDRLVENHLARVKVLQAALALGHSVSPSAEKLLRAVVDKGPDRPLKGHACLALGRYLKHQSERIRAIREDPDSVKWWEKVFLEEGGGKEYFSRFISGDPDALMKEAEVVFERTIAEFGTATARRGAEVRKLAQAELYENHNLCIGKPAPEIDGRDIDGKPFKLSDYHGKVVVLDFWTISCGACREMSAYQRSLVKRMQGKPFAVLSVNSDDEKDKVRDWMKKENVTWRTWWEGDDDARTEGPIASLFNVRGWPTLYVLDQRGVIRHKFLRDPGAKKLDAAIDALVTALESESRLTSPKPGTGRSPVPND